MLTSTSHLFTGNQTKTTSFCPVLGKSHAHVFPNHGSCPHYAKNLFGSKIPVYFCGPMPFIYYKIGSGSDFDLAKILAKKYALNMEFSPAKTSSDLVQIVRHIIKQERKFSRRPAHRIRAEGRRWALAEWRLRPLWQIQTFFSSKKFGGKLLSKLPSNFSELVRGCPV